MFIFLDLLMSTSVQQPEIEEWSSWDEEAPTSIKIEGGNGVVVPPQQNEAEEEEPDYFKDMAPTIRKTQKVQLHCEIVCFWIMLCTYQRIIAKPSPMIQSCFEQCCWAKLNVGGLDRL